MWRNSPPFSAISTPVNTLRYNHTMVRSVLTLAGNLGCGNAVSPTEADDLTILASCRAVDPWHRARMLFTSAAERTVSVARLALTDTNTRDYRSHH